MRRRGRVAQPGDERPRPVDSEDLSGRRGAAGLAVLALEGRGDLPFALLRERALFVHALGALLTAGHDVVVACDDATAERAREGAARAGLAVDVRPDGWWETVRERGMPLTLHDPLCPLVTPDLLRATVGLARQHPDTSYAGFRPVTDTVKTVVGGQVQGTIDRERLVAITAPVVLAAGLVAAAEGPPPLTDFADLVGWVRSRGSLELVKSPPLARRVDDESAVALLECIEELSRRTRHEHGSVLD